MKKETIIAISFGIILGLVVAALMIFKTKETALEKTKTVTNSHVTPTVSLKNTDLQNLQISEPADGALVNKKSIAIKGKASKDSLFVVQSPIKDLVFKNEKEDFSFDFPLALGENVIKISVYPASNQLRQQEKDLRVYYLDEQ
jgi:hypothetical protein